MSTWSDLSGRLTENGHVLPVRVYYEDTDFTGAVYHGSFVRFFERGRSDYLRLLGVHHHKLKQGENGLPLAFAVKSLQLDFARPARIDDVIEIHTRLIRAKGARIVLEQVASRDGDELARATVTVAVISEDGRPARLPETLALKLR
ncbi:YbgC/FadM family acyl-CoA thioesterase [Roseibium sp. RKSG952]|uniref:YbgC/FadM family acyl-CoA thioesterase n=1 Tax=Roseibium sp. RKSG952 TaxID=2529384 RepID=UPI001FCADF26|nr:YbgC/FadM family acyl-CoA thioesterase [Roseibium sp. RKSG952]